MRAVPSPWVPCPQAVINTMCGHGMQARGYLEASAFIHTNGCIDKLVNWTHSNLFLLGGITLGLALPQVWGSGGRRVRPKALLCGVFMGSCLNGGWWRDGGVGLGFGVGE